VVNTNQNRSTLYPFSPGCFDTKDPDRLNGLSPFKSLQRGSHLFGHIYQFVVDQELIRHIAVANIFTTYISDIASSIRVNIVRVEKHNHLIKSDNLV
jgi:hypothetical protein